MNPEQTPRVVIFTTAYLPLIGGAEVAIDQLTKRISTMRFLIITSRMSKEIPAHETQGNVEIRRLGFGYSFDKWLLPILGFVEGARLMRKESISLMWGMMVSQGSLAAYFLKKKYPQLRFVLALQEGDSEDYLNKARGGLIDYFWKKLLSVADGVTAISKHLANRAAAKGYGGAVTIIPNGADESYLHLERDDEALRMLRDKLGLMDEKVILTVSRLVEKNGIDILIRAMQNIEDHKLVIVGDGILRRELGLLASELHVEERVVFAGSVPHGSLLRYYQISDLFVRPSRSEGLGSVFLEAMASGLPIVATNVGGIADFITPEIGATVKPEDEKGLAATINMLLADDQRRANMAASAQMLVKKEYLWDGLARKYEQFLTQYMS